MSGLSGGFAPFLNASLVPMPPFNTCASRLTPNKALILNTGDVVPRLLCRLLVGESVVEAEENLSGARINRTSYS